MLQMACSERPRRLYMYTLAAPCDTAPPVVLMEAPADGFLSNRRGLGVGASVLVHPAGCRRIDRRRQRKCDRAMVPRCSSNSDWLLCSRPVSFGAASCVATRLNTRFRESGTDNLDIIGVVLHQFDEGEDPEMPWRRCRESCRFPSDRLAAQVIMSSMPKTETGSIPLHAPDVGGVVFKASKQRLLCAYPGE